MTVAVTAGTRPATHSTDQGLPVMKLIRIAPGLLATMTMTMPAIAQDAYPTRAGSVVVPFPGAA